MANKGKNYEDYCKTVCFLCLQNCKRELTIFIIERVHKLVKIGSDFNTENVPRGVCDNCQKLLKKLHQGGTKVLFSELFNFDSIHSKPPNLL